MSLDTSKSPSYARRELQQRLAAAVAKLSTTIDRVAAVSVPATRKAAVHAAVADALLTKIECETFLQSFQDHKVSLPDVGDHAKGARTSAAHLS